MFSGVKSWPCKILSCDKEGNYPNWYELKYLGEYENEFHNSGAVHSNDWEKMTRIGETAQQYMEEHNVSDINWAWIRAVLHPSIYNSDAVAKKMYTAWKTLGPMTKEYLVRKNLEFVSEQTEFKFTYNKIDSNTFRNFTDMQQLRVMKFAYETKPIPTRGKFHFKSLDFKKR